MRPPLNIKMLIRSKKDDAKFIGKPGVHHVLNSPAGGAFGMVRSEGHKGHSGWDVYAPVNTPIVAIAEGKVVSARRHGDYGLSVVLAFTAPGHPGGLYALYGHLCQASVAEGQPVKEGAILGYTGTDGNAHGQPPHLHFEIRTADPVNWDPKHPLHHRINPGTILGGHYGL